MAAKERGKVTHAEPITSPRPLGRAVPAALLMALAFIVYARVLGGGFIWDDGRAITDNLDLRSPAGLWSIWSGRGDFDYLPVKSSTLWLMYQVFGPATAPYHVLNVAIHGINAVLLWQVLLRLNVPGAWLAGLVFLVHPTHVESVAWVSECKNTLSTMFVLFSLLAWFRWQRQAGTRRYLVSLLLFACGLLSKPHVVIFPVILLLCAWWQRQLADRPSCVRIVRATMPFFLVAALFAGVTVWFQNTRAIAGYRLPAGGMASRIANAGKASWWYFGKSISLVHPWFEMTGRPIETMPEAIAVLAGARAPHPAPAWPHGTFTTWPLCAIYRQWRVTPPLWYDFLPAVAMLALFALVAGKRSGRGRGVFFAFATFGVALVPVLGLVKMSYMRAAWVADHFQYLADIGVIALVCAGGTLLLGRLADWRRHLLVGAAGVVVAVFSTMTFAYAAKFRSELALWKDTVAKNPYAWQAHGRLGAALLARGDLAGATGHFAEEARLSIDNPDAENNLGLALIAMGRVDEGIEHLRASLRIDDRQFFAHANLADALTAQRRYLEAAAEYRNAIRWKPSLAPLHFRLATVLVEAGQFEEAIANFEKADALVPDNQEIRAALASARQRRDAAR